MILIASQVIERNGKLYWYVAVEHKTIHGKAIEVAVSDSPTGPFKMRKDHPSLPTINHTIRKNKLG